MKKHIVQILPMYHTAGEELLNQLSNITKFDVFHEKEIIDFLKNHHVDGILLRAPARITPAILDACKSVKAISGAGVGLDNIAVEYATEKGIKILHAPKLNSQATAEHAVSLILATMKNLVTFHKETQHGNYDYRDGKFTIEVHRKKLGLIGFGSIAQKVAKIMKHGFDMDVLAYVRSIRPDRQKIADELGVELTTSMEDVFLQGDVISLHIPLTEETKGLIDRNYFNRMKPSAVLINTARGGIIREDDLVVALKDQKLLRAGVDVFANEPPSPNHPFFELEQLTVTPHIGGISQEAAIATSKIIVENLVKALDGEEVSTIANKQQLIGKEPKM